jgi:hypothetical protein
MIEPSRAVYSGITAHCRTEISVRKMVVHLERSHIAPARITASDSPALKVGKLASGQMAFDEVCIPALTASGACAQKKNDTNQNHQPEAETPK